MWLLWTQGKARQGGFSSGGTRTHNVLINEELIEVVFCALKKEGIASYSLIIDGIKAGTTPAPKEKQGVVGSSLSLKGAFNESILKALWG